MGNAIGAFYGYNAIGVYARSSDVRVKKSAGDANPFRGGDISLTVEKHWSSEGDVTDMPRLLHGDPVGNTRFSSLWIEDGSYVRFKVVTLGYNLPLKYISTKRDKGKCFAHR